MIIAGCALADMQALQGQLSKAWETLQRVQYWAQGPEGKPLPLAGLVDMGLGEICSNTTYWRKPGITWSAASGHPIDVVSRQPAWHVSLARLRQAMGDISGAQEVIEEAARMALSTDASEWDDAVVLQSRSGWPFSATTWRTAEQWWKKGGFPDLNTPIALENYPYHVFEYLLLTQARFLLVKGQETGRRAI
jgi:hypothetical protein